MAGTGGDIPTAGGRPGGGTPVEEHQAVGADGTRLGCYVAGTGPGVLVLCPGLGTPVVSWKHIIEEFRDVYRVVTWDARGTYRSAPPADPDALAIEDHVADLEAVAASLGLERFVLGGWSVGVEIALEYARRHPERVKGLLLLNGTYEHVLRTALGIPWADAFFAPVLKLGIAASGVVGPLMRALLGSPALIPFLQRVGFVSRDTQDFFAAMVASFRTLDWGRYFRQILVANRHSAGPYLRDIGAPALVTAGTRDVVTPVSAAERLADALPRAELFLVPNGTHYTMAEYPEILNLRIERFLRSLEPGLFAGRAEPRPRLRTVRDGG